ncbi:DsbA family oxidoreductase [Arthrobacter sp. CAU 1506]|uniref:DsbA family oxidoreductase n=1 Tax=Arthrobacter sp. CAU 1506 TaxID=2560052 RepID=UPI0010AC2D3D|nr:DsbA family oxidoreductase [Arthrobacter sp. CAU 1506]TJY69495.1 DsbA family oxidoreductase [Arthrobacter sp. CAU 1506]
MKIEIWSDIACPWCFIGKRRFETALAGFEHKDQIDVEWRSYQLDPTLPEHYDGTETEYLSRIKGMPQEQVKQMFGHVTAQAAGEGLNYDFDKVVVANSFTAHRFLHLAKEHGLMDQAKDALLSGHFEQGQDIGDPEYLVSTGVALGLDEAEIRETLACDRYAAEVRADIAEARALGVNGVPFFVLDRKYGISGAQPAEAFAQAIRQAWNERSPLTVLPQSTSADGAVCGPDGCN